VEDLAELYRVSAYTQIVTATAGQESLLDIRQLEAGFQAFRLSVDHTAVCGIFTRCRIVSQYRRFSTYVSPKRRYELAVLLSV
jgi:hypothetical protein